MPGIFFKTQIIRTGLSLFFCSRSDLALPERALLRSILQLRTRVRACRLSLAKPARLCDIAPDSGMAGVAPIAGLKPGRHKAGLVCDANQREALDNSSVKHCFAM